VVFKDPRVVLQSFYVQLLLISLVSSLNWKVSMYNHPRLAWNRTNRAE